MNFLVKTYSSACILRPDVSLNRDGVCYYVPDDVHSLSVVPIAFIRLSKTGKAIGQSFARRYYDAVGIGALLYPCTNPEGRVDVAAASCFDQSSFFPQPFFNPLTMEKESNRFAVRMEGVGEYEANCKGLLYKLEEALVECSAHTLARIGDFVAVELLGLDALVMEKKSGSGKLEIEFCEKKVLEIAIKF